MRSGDAANCPRGKIHLLKNHTPKSEDIVLRQGEKIPRSFITGWVRKKRRGEVDFSNDEAPMGTLMGAQSI